MIDTLHSEWIKLRTVRMNAVLARSATSSLDDAWITL